MPFYDYKCTGCGSTFEIQKGMNQEIDPKCPKCASPSERVFHIPRTIRSDEDLHNTAGSEQSGACNTCTSGVCSTCGVNR